MLLNLDFSRFRQAKEEEGLEMRRKQARASQLAGPFQHAFGELDAEPPRAVCAIHNPSLSIKQVSACTEYMSDTWAMRTAGENENKTSGLGHHAQRSPFEFWPVTCHGLSVWDGVEGGSHHDSGAKEPMPAQARSETAGLEL